jgi:hypothetical protein
MIVATFGIRDADSSPQVSRDQRVDRDGITIVDCSRCAMKLALLAQNYRQQMIRYQSRSMKIDSRSDSRSATTNNKKNVKNIVKYSRLATNIGVHSCSIPVSSLLPPSMRSTKTETKEEIEQKEEYNSEQENKETLKEVVKHKEVGKGTKIKDDSKEKKTNDNNRMTDLSSTKDDNSKLEVEDDSLIYKIDDNHVDFAVELSWIAKQFKLEVVISPQTMVMLSRSEEVRMKDIIVRDLDILRSNAYPTRPLLKVFELIAFEHVGSHDPGLLKAIRHYETGLLKYRKRHFKEAVIHFQSATAIYEDSASAVMYVRSKEYQKQPPPENWKGEWELSKSNFTLE